MDEPADVTSKNRTRTHVLDQGSTTRNRKVVGLNPASGSTNRGSATRRPMQSYAALVAALEGGGHVRDALR